MNARIVYSLTGNKTVVLLKEDSMKVLLCHFYKCKIHIVYVYSDSASQYIDSFTPEMADVFIDCLMDRLNKKPWYKRILN